MTAWKTIKPTNSNELEKLKMRISWIITLRKLDFIIMIEQFKISVMEKKDKKQMAMA